MRHVNHDIPNLALWIVPLLLVVPNVLLAFTEGWPLLYKITDIALAFGAFLVVISLTRNIGWMIILCFPFIFYSAFQIVLLYLYDGGIIAIDMFVNVATTNFTEATELLRNLKLAMGTVFILYLPPLIWAIYAIVKKKHTSRDALFMPRLAGWTLVGAGLVFLALCYFMYPNFDARKHLFPLNVVCNTVEAANRTVRTNHYPETSTNFSYRATSTRPADEKEVYVMVIGETARADNWQLMGYDRPTNPKLIQRSGLVAFPRAMSESNTTHKSVPIILSYLNARNFGDSIYHTKGIVSAFKDAGYCTAFFSAQRRNHSFIDYFGEEADAWEFIVENGDPQKDDYLMPHLKCFIDTANADKLFIVLHSYGSHFNYTDRYPEQFAQFQPCDYLSAQAKYRDELINAYDNSILYTDSFLNDICDELEDTGVPAALVYLSDHGEDIFDDQRGRFLHASPTPTFYQLHVPMIAWMSPAYIEKYPDKYRFTLRHRLGQVDSSESAFHTMLDIAGITSPYFYPSKSLANKAYADPVRLYINDYNEGVSLHESGFQPLDFRKLEMLAHTP